MNNNYIKISKRNSKKFENNTINLIEYLVSKYCLVRSKGEQNLKKNLFSQSHRNYLY